MAKMTVNQDRCKGCGRIVMLERPEFEKRMKKHLGKDVPEET